VEFERLGLDSFSTSAIDEPPPNKRRRIDPEIDLLDQVIEKLYTLLGSQNVTDLAGLSQVTV
jgi:hypothetical protein